MFPQYLSYRSPSRHECKTEEIHQIPASFRATRFGSPDWAAFPPAGAMSPVRLAAGAVLALSGAASWLLPDPWLPPPHTCALGPVGAATCSTDGAPPAAASWPPMDRPYPGTGPAAAMVAPTSTSTSSSSSTAWSPTDLPYPGVGPAASTVAPTSAPTSATSSSAAGTPTPPSSEGPDPPRRRGGPPHPPFPTPAIRGFLETIRILGFTKVGGGC